MKKTMELRQKECYNESFIAQCIKEKKNFLRPVKEEKIRFAKEESYAAVQPLCE